MRLGAWIGLVLALSALALPAQAGPPKIRSNFKFDETSKYGLIVVYVRPQTVVPNYRLVIEKFSLDERRWDYGPLKGWSDFAPIGSGQSGFAMSAVEPGGTYAINAITTQGFWGGCFNGGTKAFEVKPGQVTFIGVLDPLPTLVQIIRGLPSKTNGTHYYVFDTPRPALTPPAEAPNWQPALTEYLAKYPGIIAPVVAAEPVDTSFSPARSLGSKICERY